MAILDLFSHVYLPSFVNILPKYLSQLIWVIRQNNGKMAINNSPSRIELIFLTQGFTLHVRCTMKPRVVNAWVQILNNNGLHTAVNPRDSESTECLQWVEVMLNRHNGKLLPTLTAALRFFRKLLNWDRTSCGLVYVYHTSLGNFRFYSPKGKFYTLKTEAAYVCEILNKSFWLYMESHPRNFYSRRRENFRKPSVIFILIFLSFFKCPAKTPGE
jgi:hypothetical protein